MMWFSLSSYCLPRSAVLSMRCGCGAGLLAEDLHPELLAHKLDDIQRLTQPRAVRRVALGQLPPRPKACLHRHGS